MLKEGDRPSIQDSSLLFFSATENFHTKWQKVSLLTVTRELLTVADCLNPCVYWPAHGYRATKW